MGRLGRLKRLVLGASRPTDALVGKAAATLFLCIHEGRWSLLLALEGFVSVSFVSVPYDCMAECRMRRGLFLLVRIFHEQNSCSQGILIIVDDIFC